MHLKPTLFDMDWQGVILLRVLLLTHLWEGHSQASANPLMMMGYPRIHPSPIGPPEGGMGAEEAKVAGAVVILMGPTPLGDVDVAGTFRQSAHCITYYHDYYEHSYLMPLVVSSLTGDASDVFDWILSLNLGNTQDLTTLLQMLREHYCGSLTFR